jgi:OmpA-OmpF porin, OOP family
MRHGIGLVAFACGVPMALCARPAGATDCSGILSTCIDDDTLWPHAGPAHFVAVGSTETTAGGQLGFGLVTTYLSRPIVINVKSPGGAGSNQYVVNEQANGTFLWSYGVNSHLELDLALPLTFAQDGAGLMPVTGGQGLQSTAQRDIRFGLAYALLPQARDRAASHGTPDGWGLLARFEMSAPTGDRSEFAGEGTGVYVPSLAADYRLGRWFAGAEVGARLRPTTELLGGRIGSQIVTALGLGVDLMPRELLSATLEGWALPTLVDQATVSNATGAYTSVPNGSHVVPAEWQLSARTSPLRGGDLSVQLSGGGAIPIGGDDVLTRPVFRFTLGVRWAPQGKASVARAPATSVEGSP